ncbi:hypothetical protein ATE72_08405 [Sphingopyxis sp. HXXIV]|nr:hypothetical protein ATE72_08405 [Sphingopyxis sp. HXXIV]
MHAAEADLAARWRSEDSRPAGLAAALAAAAAVADPVRAVEPLRPWLADTSWLTTRFAEALALLAADPFARPPLPVVGSGGAPGGLILAERGAVRLSLQLLPFEIAGALPATALFVPGRAAIRVLAAGGASLILHHVALSEAEAAGAFTAAGAAPCTSDPPRPLRTGELLELDTTRTTFTLAGASGDVLLLDLSVRPPSQLPVRAYDIASGRLVHVAASRRDSSFRQMALALLRAMERRAAAPLFLAATQAEDFAARWAAMRDLVALAPAAAHPRLVQMAADDPHPEVRAAATATLALYAAPNAEPCPA